MKRRVVMILVGSALTTIVGIQSVQADVRVPSRFTQLDLRSARLDLPLADGFGGVEVEVGIRLNTTSSLSDGTNFINVVDPTTVKNGDPVSIDMLLNVPIQIWIRDVDATGDLAPGLFRDPSDPSMVILDSFLFIDSLIGSSPPAVLDVPNMGLTRGVTEWEVQQPQPINVGDMDNDGGDDFVSLFPGTITTSLLSEGHLTNGQLSTELSAATTFVFSVNPTFSVDLTGTFTIAEDIIIPASAVPVPAAVWLFGSGLLGLIGMARRKEAA